MLPFAGRTFANLATPQLEAAAGILAEAVARTVRAAELRGWPVGQRLHADDVARAVGVCLGFQGRQGPSLTISHRNDSTWRQCCMRACIYEESANSIQANSTIKRSKLIVLNSVLRCE